MFEFTINYSKEEKLYVVLTTNNKEFYEHFNHNDIIFIKDYIQGLVK